MTKMIGKLIGVSVLLGAVSGAFALDNIKFTGSYGPDDLVTIKDAHINNGNPLANVVAGFLQFQNLSNGGAHFETVCGDIFDEISGGSTYNAFYDTTNPYTGGSRTYSTFNGNVTVAAANIQSAANIVSADFDSIYSGGSNDQAAGLQIAVWATLNDAIYTNQSEATFDTMIQTTGAMTITSISGGNQAAVFHDAYLDWKNDGTAGNAVFLAASPSDAGQDQFTTTGNLPPSGTPEPFTMGIGAAGIGLAIRRRMKRSR